MSNKILISLLAISATALLNGCIEETFPEGSTVTSSQVAESPTALEAMLKSIPAAMVTTNTAGYLDAYDHHGDFGIGEIHLITENMLEDFVTLSENPYYNRNYAWASCKSQGADYWPCSYFWDTYYAWIKTCNDIISSILSGGEPTESTAVILGKAYAYRANFYLDLARLYDFKPNRYTTAPGGVEGLTVPIIDEKTDTEKAANNPRADRETIYNFILSDLENAATYLADAPSTVDEPSINLVNGLFARTYLEMGANGVDGAYEKAAEYAERVLGAGYVALTQEQWEDPANGFNNRLSQNSWIWGLTISPENFNNICAYGAFICNEGQWGYAPLVQLGASKSFYEAISNKDFRKHSWLDPAGFDFYNYKLAGTAADQNGFINGNSNVPASAEYESIKFRPGSGNCSDYTIGNVVDVPMMRVEEMYFIKAEALAQSGKLSDAATVLNNFMKLRILDGTYAFSANSKEDFLEELLFQKRVEFWGEGILLFDYKRLDHGITRGYAGTNWPSDWCFNSEGRSPQWNIVITRAETQTNNGIPPELNNPDPSNFAPLWTE